jgi:hypothetical protein
MNSAAAPDFLVDWLEQEFLKEVSDPFSLIRKIPDTAVILRLDNYLLLDPTDQSRWRRTMAGWAASNLCGQRPNSQYADYQAVCSLSGLNSGLSYTAVQLLDGLRRDPAHASLADYFRQRGTTELAMQLPAEIVDPNDPLEPATPAMLRRQIKSSLGQLLNAQTQDLGSETFRYTGILNDQPIAVDIRYSGRMGRAQMAYQVKFPHLSSLGLQSLLNFESALGIGMGHWDYLTKNNFKRCLETFCAALMRVSQMSQRIPTA